MKCKYTCSIYHIDGKGPQSHKSMRWYNLYKYILFEYISSVINAFIPQSYHLQLLLTPRLTTSKK